jgi:very-short-patch-repair endonuclease
MKIRNRYKKKNRTKTSPKSIAVANARALEMRENPTDAEKFLELKLQELGITHYFQFPFCYKGKMFIIDFCFPRGTKTRLMVEIDGGYHLTDKQKEKDSFRTSFLILHTGCEVMRFTNEEVLSNIDNVVERIRSKLT